jgi:hypothetical protein
LTSCVYEQEWQYEIVHENSNLLWLCYIT